MSGLSDSKEPHSAPERSARAEKYYIYGMAFALAFLPLIGYIAPRSLAFVPGLIGLLGFFAGWYVYKICPRLHKKSLYIVIPVVTLALASVIWAINPDESSERVLKIGPILISGIALFSVVQNYGANLLPLFTRIFPVITLLVMVLFLIDLTGNGAVHSLMRGVSVDGNFNKSELNRGIIILLLSLIPACAIVKFDQTFWDIRRMRLYYALALGLLLGVAMMTDSQSAHLIILVCALFWIFFPVSMRAAWYALWAVLSALIFAAPWLAQYMFAVLPALISDVEWFQQSYALNRLEIWDYVGRYIESRPLFGFGIEATRIIEDFESAYLYDDKATVLHPHNFALQLWIEFGVIGAAFASAALGYILWALMHLKPASARIGLVVLMGVLCPMAVAYGLWQGWFLGMFIMSGAFGLIAMQKCNQSI